MTPPPFHQNVLPPAIFSFLLPPTVPAPALQQLAKHLHRPSLLQLSPLPSCRPPPFRHSRPTYSNPLQSLPNITPLFSSRPPAACQASPPLQSAVTLYTPFLTPPPTLALPPIHTATGCIPLLLPPPLSAPALQQLPKHLHRLSLPQPPKFPPGRRTLQLQPIATPYNPFLLPLPFSALALQQLAKHLHRPNLFQPSTFLLDATPPSSFLTQVDSHPLHLLFAVDLFFSSRSPAAQQASPWPCFTPTLYISFLAPTLLPAAPLQSTPSPYILFLLPAPFAAPAFQQLAKHLCRLNLLQSRTIPSCRHPPLQLSRPNLLPTPTFPSRCHSPFEFPPCSSSSSISTVPAHCHRLQSFPAVTPLPNFLLPAARQVLNLLTPSTFPTCHHPPLQLSRPNLFPLSILLLC